MQLDYLENMAAAEDFNGPKSNLDDDIYSYRYAKTPNFTLLPQPLVPVIGQFVTNIIILKLSLNKDSYES